MITCTWSAALGAEDAAAVHDLLDKAGKYDAEAGFSTVLPDLPPAACGITRHLVVALPSRGRPGSPHPGRRPDATVVAYLRLDVVDGVGDVQLVVRPDFRSLGVATLLLERLATEKWGWASIPGLTTLRAWAHGEHPAAQRMRMRSGAKRELAVFKTLRAVGGGRPFRGGELSGAEREPTDETPEVAHQHGLTMAPGDRAVLALGRVRIRAAGGRDCVVVGVAPADPASAAACVAFVRGKAEGAVVNVRALLSQALLDVQREGARTAQMYVDALDEAFVSASRELGFVHDQSDVRFALSL